MRLRRLDLTRYGKFTERSIDFGEREPGQPDLHIVYGPNEAGKSTALAAFLDLLFGIEPRSRFNFIHPYNVMRIGGALEFGGQVHELVRVKRAQNDLLDGNDLPIAAGALAGQLGGIDRDAYRSMFSLDDETLEAGGESILASKGDLGQLLFSASTGLADLSRALTALRAEADEFYRYHARSGELLDLKARLATLKAQREQIDTAASAYAQLIEARDRAEAQYDDAIASRTAIQSRMEEIQRHLTALPRLAAVRTLRAQLLPLAGLPAAPAGWRQALAKLRADEIPIAVQSETIGADVEQKTRDLDAIVIDKTALALADRVEALDAGRARFLTAGKDIPDRALEVRERDVAIASLLARIGRDGERDPRRLVLDARTVAALQDLIAKRSGVETAAETAGRELSDARDLLAEAEAALGEANPDRDQAPLTALAAVVAALQADDHAARRRVAERNRGAALEALTERLAALRPWSGDADRLSLASVPEAGDIQRWKAALAAAQTRLDRCEAEVERLNTDRLRLEAERYAITQVSGIVTDQDASAVRAEREAAWTEHRRVLDGGSADRYEAALRRDDSVLDARMRHQSDLARLNQTSQTITVNAAEIVRAKQLLADAGAQVRAIQNELEAAFSPTLPAGMSIAQIEAWVSKRDKALEIRQTLRLAERELREAEADGEALRQRLAAALAAAAVAHDGAAAIDTLRIAAQTALDRAGDLRSRRAAADKCRRDVAARERKLALATDKETAWQAAWTEACAGCWLGEAGVAWSPRAVRDIIPATVALGSELEKRTSLLDRIERMRDDQRAFAAEVMALAEALEMAPDPESPLDLARAIAERVRTAVTGLAMQRKAAAALTEARARQERLAAERTIHERQKAEMTGHFSVDSLADVADRLSEVERRTELQSRVEAAERELLDGLRVASLEDAATVLDQADRSALEAEMAEAKARFDDQDQRTRELFSAHSKAVDRVEAVGGDAAVAKIEEERRTTLLEIEDSAQRYLRLRVGIVAAEHALRAYRQRHRSSMLEHASDAFRTVSREAYSGLASQPNKDSEILIAVAADGGSKVASELSKGTRFQLYLALRLAGYHEFSRTRVPVPFIADDIMETFDDFRAEEAFRLLADMGEVGQVIYMTHHRHLCDIAQRICPRVRVHELGSSLEPALGSLPP